MRRGLFMVVALVGLAACGSNGSKPVASSSSSTSSTSTTGPADNFGQTEWVDVTGRWKALAPKAFDASPDAVAEDLAALLRGGPTSEVGVVEVVSVQRGEPALVTIRETGLPDDATASIETEITLEPGDEGWLVSSARARQSCRRGVATTDPTGCM